jgi:hypothetical protein
MSPVNKTQAASTATVKPDGEVAPRIFTVTTNSSSEKSWGWTREEWTLDQFIEKLTSHHTRNKKDGYCYVPAAIVGERRKANAVEHLEMAVYDIDGGQTYDAVKEVLEASGYAYAVSTTFSHLTSETEISAGALEAWALKSGYSKSPRLHLGAGCLDAYLTHKKRREIIGEYTVEESLRKTEKGVQVVIRHKPLEKFRVCLPLARPFILADHGFSEKDQQEAWKSHYIAIGNALGLNYDLACADVCRLFYSPACPEESGRVDSSRPFRAGHNVEGRKLIDYSDFTPFVSDAPKAEAQTKPKGAARNNAKAQETANSKLTHEQERARANVKRFLGKHSKTFKLAAALQQRDVATIHDTREKGGIFVTCPFEGEHTSTGHQRTFAVDGDGEHGCYVHCSGNACQMADGKRRDRIEYFAQMLEDGWLTWDDLKNPALGGGPFSFAVAGGPFMGGGVWDEQSDAAKVSGDDLGLDHPDEAIADLRQTAFLCRQINGGEIATVIPAHGHTKLPEKAKVEFDRMADLFASKHKLSLDKAQALLQREISRQEAPKEVLKYIDRYAHISVGGRHMIVDTSKPKSDHALQVTPALIELNAFDFDEYPDKKGGTFRVEHAKEFVFTHTRATRYIPSGFVFDPRRAGDALGSDTLNLYTGMQVKPNEAGSCELLKRLIREVWCKGDEILFAWVWEKLLHMIARPWERTDTSIAIRGEYGAGKSLVWKCLRKILGDLMLMVEKEDQILGTFNSSLKGKLCVVLEEAAFAGSPALFDKLKHVVTSSVLNINEKHKPAYDIDNYAEMVIISNHDHFMHVKQNDRRYTILEACEDAGKRWAEENLYEKLWKEWTHGGAERFVYEALAHKFRIIEGTESILVIQRNIKTDALADQVSQSRNPLEAVLAKFLMEGKLSPAALYGETKRDVLTWHDTEPTEIGSTELLDLMVAAMKAHASYDSKRHSSLKAVTAILKRFGIVVPDERKTINGAKVTVRVLPPRLMALEAALKIQAITKAEYRVGCGEETFEKATAEQAVARARKDTAMADATAEREQQEAITEARDHEGKRRQAALKRFVEGLELDEDEQHYKAILVAAQKESKELPNMRRARELQLVGIRGRGDRQKLEAEIADIVEREKELPAEIEAAERALADAEQVRLKRSGCDGFEHPTDWEFENAYAIWWSSHERQRERANQTSLH